MHRHDGDQRKQDMTPLTPKPERDHWGLYDPKVRCQMHVSSQFSSMTGGQCRRLGTVERNGKLWCKAHDPIVRQAKDDALTARAARIAGKDP
jgi:hypothetical protein